MEPGSNADLAIEGVELRLQRALARQFLRCMFVAGSESFFTHTIVSLPLDQSMGINSCPDDQIVPDADCYLVEGSFTATIFYLKEQTEGSRELLREFVSNRDVYGEYKAFLESVFDTSSLFTQNVLGLTFNSILNTAAPSMSQAPSPYPTPEPSLAPSVTPSIAPTRAPVSYVAPTPTRDVDDGNDGARGIAGDSRNVDNDTVAILWYIVAAIFALAIICVIYICIVRPPPESPPERTSVRKRPVEKPVTPKRKSSAAPTSSSPKSANKSYSKMDDDDESFIPSSSHRDDDFFTGPSLFNDDQSETSGYVRTIEAYQSSQPPKKKKASQPVFVSTQEVLSNVSKDELKNAIDELYKPTD